jgi:hypothetical protein
MCQIVKFLTTSFFIFNFVFTDENQNLNWNFENILYPKENFHQQFPDATIGSNGIIHVVWVEQYGNQKSIQYSKSNSEGENFSQPIQVNSINNNIIAYSQSGPKIRAYGNSIFIIFMMSNSNNYESIYLSTSEDNGNTWTQEIEIGSPDQRNVYPDFEIDLNGMIHLVNYSFHHNWHFEGVFYRSFFPDSLNFSIPILIDIISNDEEPCDCCQPDLAVTDSNDIFIAYRNNISSIRDSYIIKKSIQDSVFSVPTIIAEHNDFISFCPTSGPMLALNNTHIAASYYVFNGQNSFLNFSNLDSLNFNNETILNDNFNQQNFSYPIIYDNYVHLVWVENIAGNSDIFYGISELEENSGIQNIQRVNQDSTFGFATQKDPILLKNEDKVLCFWTDGRSGDFQIYFSKASLDSSTMKNNNTEKLTTPSNFKLFLAYPNPFNPITTIRYDLPEDGLVNITIYDMLGNVVNNLVGANQSSGFKSIQWNATNNQGHPVSAGVYLYSIEAGDFRATKKMILLK